MATTNAVMSTRQARPYHPSKPRPAMLYPQRTSQICIEDAVKRLLADSAKRRRKRGNVEGMSSTTGQCGGKRPTANASLERWYRKSISAAQGPPVDRDSWRQQVQLRLRRGLRRLRTMLCCFRVIIHFSQQRTSWTATELQWFTLHNNKDVSTLAFNPAHFASSAGHTKIPHWARCVMSKEPRERTEVECRKLHALLRGMRCFERFTERIQLAMCRAFTYCSVSSQRVLLRKGHVGQFYYIVYSGSVFVNVQDTRADGQVFHKTQAILMKGDAFGELALLTSCRRNATITCREDCELLAVDKDIFSVVCPRIFEHELEVKTQFLGQLPLFHGKYWSTTQLRLLSAEAQIQEYKTNKVVVANSQEDEWVYICMEGECRVIKYLVLTDAPAIIVEEEMPYDDDITAEFLDSMKAAAGQHDSSHVLQQPEEEGQHRDGEPAREEGESERVLRRQGMLDSMKLQYEDRLVLSRRQSANRLPRGDSSLRSSRPSLLSRNEMVQQVMTFHALVESRRQNAHPQDAVYLNIGSLRPRQIFDLVEVLHPVHRPTNGNSVMLVSSGAKLLRLPRMTLRKQMTPEAQHHADHLCVSARYPADSTLLSSYRQRSAWDAFKQKTMQQVLKASRKNVKPPTIPQQSCDPQLDRKQRNRVMRTLRRGSIEPEPEKVTSEGLDTPEVEHEDSESRYMKQLAVPSIQRLIPGARAIQEYRARAPRPKPIY